MAMETDKLHSVCAGEQFQLRVVTNTRKYDRGLHHAMRYDLHWLDMIDRIQFRIAVTVYLPDYLSELLVPASTRSSRYCLRSSDSNQLVVPPAKLSTYGRRAFNVSGPLRYTLSHDSFRRYLKTYLFARY